MTHASIPVERREQLGISDALVRLSVGVEELGICSRTGDGAAGRSFRFLRRSIVITVPGNHIEF